MIVEIYTQLEFSRINYRKKEFYLEE